MEVLNLIKDNIEIFISLFSLLIVFFVVIYVSISVGRLSQKVGYFQTSIDKLYKEMRDIKTWIENSEQEIQYSTQKANMKIKNEVEARVKDAIDVEMVELGREIDILDSKLQSEREFLDERISILESKIHQLNYTPGSTSTNIDESKIIELFKQGNNIEQISKSVRMGVGEVEFILQLSGLK